MNSESRAQQESSSSGRPEADAGAAYAAVSLEFDAEDGVLLGRITACDEPVHLGLGDLQQQVDEQGFGELNFQPDALMGLIRHLQQRDFGEYVIATRSDAEISVAPTADRLQALLTTTRPYGGAPVTQARLDEAIAAAGIRRDTLIPEALARALEGVPVTNLVIAEGQAPVSGTDSRVELLVDLDGETAGPKENAQGRVDHYSVRDFVIVEAGTPLLKRCPATRGVAGHDVSGKPITARDGKEVPLPKEMAGVVTDPADPMRLLAEYKGHPVVIPGGIRVDKTLLLEHVDLRTGNIDFDGSVLVAGDVSAGVTVKATGDITVKGSVERAFLDAGGDLQVACGVTGSEIAMQGGVRDISIEAGRDVTAGFVSGIRVRAGRNILIKEYLNHCDAFALGRVLVGQDGGRGIVVGGYSHGCQGVAARAAGTPANVITHISTGMHAELQESQERLECERDELLDRLAQLKAMLTGMQERDEAQGDDRHKLLDKVRRTIDDYELRTAEVDREIATVAGDVDTARKAEIACDQHVYPGVIIEIGPANLTVRSGGSGGRFTYRNGQIAWE